MHDVAPHVAGVFCGTFLIFGMNRSQALALRFIRRRTRSYAAALLRQKWLVDAATRKRRAPSWVQDATNSLQRPVGQALTFSAAPLAKGLRPNAQGTVPQGLGHTTTISTRRLDRCRARSRIAACRLQRRHFGTRKLKTSRQVLV